MAQHKNITPIWQQCWPGCIVGGSVQRETFYFEKQKQSTLDGHNVGPCLFVVTDENNHHASWLPLVYVIYSVTF